MLRSNSLIKILVVTVAYHPGTEILALARSVQLSKTEIELDLKFIVADNADLRAQDPVLYQQLNELGAQVVGDGINRGYGGGINWVLEKLGYLQQESAPDFLLVVNPDAVLETGFWPAMLAAAQEHSNYGAFGPATFDTDGTLYPSARPIPGLRIGLGHGIFGKIWPNNPWTRRYLQLATKPLAQLETQEVGWVSGSCVLVRWKAFCRVGGFDDGYFMFFEDVDLGMRLAQAGYPSIFVPTARITHARHLSWKARPTAMLYAHHNSAARFLDKRYPKKRYIPLKIVLKLGLKLRVKLLVAGANRRR